MQLLTETLRNGHIGPEAAIEQAIGLCNHQESATFLTALRVKVAGMRSDIEDEFEDRIDEQYDCGLSEGKREIRDLVLAMIDNGDTKNEIKSQLTEQ